MIVKTYYDGGHVVVFDTANMTESLPQPGNLLTNETGIDIELEACNRMGFPFETFRTIRNSEPAEDGTAQIDRGLFAAD